MTKTQSIKQFLPPEYPDFISFSINSPLKIKGERGVIKITPLIPLNLRGIPIYWAMEASASKHLDLNHHLNFGILNLTNGIATLHSQLQCRVVSHCDVNMVVKKLGNMNPCEQLRSKLEEAVERNRADGILLSGGVDTGILAFVARPSIGFTVALKDSLASDLGYSEKISRLLGIQHEKMEFTTEEALNTLPEVIRILKTFDLALPNDLSIYFALKLARENRISSVMTGDGADELFAGYSYMAELPPKDLERYIRSLSQNWHFSANELGRALDVEIRQPFLDEDFVRFALEISPELKVKDGVGKYILRKSFEDLIPPEIVWRRKEPIECGSGSAKLHEIVNSMVTDEEFQSARKEVDIKFINKEHFFYWRIYNQVVGKIPKASDDEIGCPCCRAGMGTYHCPTCGFSRSLL